MKNHIEIIINPIEPSVSDVMIAELTNRQFDGFLEEDSLLKAYIDAELFEEKDFKLLMNKHNLTYSLSIIMEKNWNAVWESNFSPVYIDDFVGIRAFFHEPLIGFEYELVITPKMSFGTGHHATTSSVIQLMKNINFKNRQVFDFGTGTGILAILAEKLGADHVLAVDNDEWCINNAEENILINNCKNISIQLVDSIDNDSKFDVVIANINRHIIEANLHFMEGSLNCNGDLILSGLLHSDESAIVEQSTKLGLHHIKTLEKEGWVALYFVKQ